MDHIRRMVGQWRYTCWHSWIFLAWFCFCKGWFTKIMEGCSLCWSLVTVTMWTLGQSRTASMKISWLSLLLLAAFLWPARGMSREERHKLRWAEANVEELMLCVQCNQCCSYNNSWFDLSPSLSLPGIRWLRCLTTLIVITWYVSKFCPFLLELVIISFRNESWLFDMMK